MEPTSKRPAIGLSIGVGETLVAIGAIAVAVSIVLRWADLSQGQAIFRRTARGVPVQVLWDYTTKATDPSLLVVLVPVVVLCLLGIVVRRARSLALVAGTLAVLVGGVYIFQTHQALRAQRASLPGISLGDFLGIAPYVCIAGGAIVLLGAAWPTFGQRA
jgi:hypothetical protein